MLFNCLLDNSLYKMDSDSKAVDSVPREETTQQKKKNYRKDKPWDGDHIDHWKIEVTTAMYSIM